MNDCLGFNYYTGPAECYLKKILKDECPIIYDPNGVAYLKFELGKVLIFKSSDIIVAWWKYSTVLSQNHNRLGKSQ